MIVTLVPKVPFGNTMQGLIDHIHQSISRRVISAPDLMEQFGDRRRRLRFDEAIIRSLIFRIFYAKE
jgi:hypothetical protein